EGEPGLGDPVILRRLAVELPVARLRGIQGAFQHRGDRLAALDGLDVPAEGDQVAPVAVSVEHRRGAGRIVARQCGGEGGEPICRPLGRSAHGVPALSLIFILSSVSKLSMKQRAIQLRTASITPVSTSASVVLPCTMVPTSWNESQPSLNPSSI